MTLRGSSFECGERRPAQSMVCLWNAKRAVRTCRGGQMYSIKVSRRAGSCTSLACAVSPGPYETAGPNVARTSRSRT
jgi:hypothetical protein